MYLAVCGLFPNVNWSVGSIFKFWYKWCLRRLWLVPSLKIMTCSFLNKNALFESRLNNTCRNIYFLVINYLFTFSLKKIVTVLVESCKCCFWKIYKSRKIGSIAFTFFLIKGAVLYAASLTKIFLQLSQFFSWQHRKTSIERSPGIFRNVLHGSLVKYLNTSILISQGLSLI